MSENGNRRRSNQLRGQGSAKAKQGKSKKAGKGRLRAFVSSLGSTRSRRTFGLFLILFSLFLLISLISYLFHWKLDDSLNSFGQGEESARNLGGWAGHTLSYFLIKQCFGIATLLLPPLGFVAGVTLASGVRIIQLGKSTRHVLFGLLWISLTLAFILQGTGLELLGGQTGLHATGWLIRLLGKPGTGILLFFILGTYLLTSWNIPWEKIFTRKKAPEQVNGTLQTSEPVNRLKEDPDEQSQEPEVAEEAEPGEDQKSDLISGMEDEDEDADAGMKPSTIIPEDIELTVERAAENEPVEHDRDYREHRGLDEPFDPTLDLPSYQLPPLELLNEYAPVAGGVNQEELKANKDRIVNTLLSYGIQIDKIKATIGPTITLYEIIPAPGIRISKIKNLSDDIALSLSAVGIRIIAPLPGKGTIGIEVPNQNPETVSIRSILASERFRTARMELPIGLGKTIANESYIADLTKMPHLLIAGATGQGKSVGLNAIITSILYRKHPAEVKFVMVDPKKVELTLFSKIERHFLAKLPDVDEAIITDNRTVVRTLNSLGLEMDMRYTLLNQAQVRNIKEYNQKFLSRSLNPNDGHRYLPYIIVVIDEFADLIMTSGKEVELPLTRLAQLARAIGIHLIIATQRPSTNIITGTIKANFPARIAFRVISMVDSRTILDSPGANHLIGRGDMLLSTGSDLLRLQCAFVDTPEVEKVTDFIGSQRGYLDAHHLPEYVDELDESNKDLDPNDKDEMFEDAARIIVQHQHGSTSLLQRKLKLGYNRAGRIIDQLEAANIVGPFEGSKAREVKFKDLNSLEQYLDQIRNDNL